MKREEKKKRDQRNVEISWAAGRATSRGGLRGDEAKALPSEDRRNWGEKKESQGGKSERNR